MTRGGAHGGLKVRAFLSTQTKTTLIRTGVQVAYGSGDEGKIEEHSGGEAGMWHCCLFRMDGCGLKIVLKAVSYLIDDIAVGRCYMRVVS